MTDQTEVQTTAPVTITLSIEALAKHLVPDYDAPYDEDGPPPMGALDGILGHVAGLLVTEIRKEWVDAAAKQAQVEVAEQVAELVRSVLDEGAVVGDGYSKTTVKPLRELIRDEVTAWTTKQTGDFRSRETSLQGLVRTEVDKALKTDLATVLEEQRVIFKAAVQAAAAKQISDAAAKRV